MRQNREFLVPLTCPALGDASVGRQKGWNRFGATGTLSVKSASGKFWSFSPLSHIFREKIPSVPCRRIQSGAAGKNRAVREGFGDGFVPGWDTLRGLSWPEFDPEKSRGSWEDLSLKTQQQQGPEGWKIPFPLQRSGVTSALPKPPLIPTATRLFPAFRDCSLAIPCF